MSNDTSAASRFGPKARMLGMLAAGAVAGGTLAATLTANAADSTPSPSPSADSPSYSSNGGPPANNFGSSPVRTDEKTPSASIVATLTKKALAAVPGGTVYRVETDAGDAAYEAHMKKSDGTLVTVKFDKDLNVTKVEAGMGLGDPAPNGGGAPGGPGGSGGLGGYGGSGSSGSGSGA